MRVANAPVSYGVFELTAGDAGLPDPDELLAAIAGAGYVGTELGPPGYLGRGAELRARLDRHGLALAGSFLPLRMSRSEHVDEDLATLDAVLDGLDAATDAAARPSILLSDAFCEPDRMQHAGRIDQEPSTWLDDARFDLLVDTAHRAAERCRARGYVPSFHYHAGTYVETGAEVERLAARLDPTLLGVCLDTGHSAFGGGDALALLERHGDLINHVHLKDVDLDVMAEIRGRGLGLEEAWRRGVFCRLGTGGVDVAAVIDALREHDYHGWLVVEQDRYGRPGETLADPARDQAASRAYLRELGV